MNSLGPDEQTPTANADLIAAVVSSSPAVVSSSPDIPDEAIEAAADALCKMYPGIGINPDAIEVALVAAAPAIIKAYLEAQHDDDH